MAWDSQYGIRTLGFRGKDWEIGVQGLGNWVEGLWSGFEKGRLGCEPGAHRR